MARFLICWPESTIGVRMYREGGLDAAELRAFDDRMIALLSQPLPIDDAASMALKPPLLELEPEAFEIWCKYHDTIEAALGSHGENAELCDLGAKIAEQAARIAGVMHVFEHGPIGVISAETMKAGADIAIWHLHETHRVFGLVDADQATQDAKLLLGWLVDQSEPPTLDFTARRAPYRLRNKARGDGALAKLETHGLVRREQRNGSTIIALNPARGG